MELHDIFPTVAIVEYSFYYLLSFIFIALLLGYALYKIITKKRKNKSYYIQILQRYPKDNARYTAYLFSYYGKYIAKEAHQKTILAEINHALHTFKYTYNSHNVPLTIQEKIHFFLGEKDV